MGVLVTRETKQGARKKGALPISTGLRNCCRDKLLNTGHEAIKSQGRNSVYIFVSQYR